MGSASNGIQDLFAKNLHVENVYADRGTFNDLSTGSLMASSTITSELCVDDICVTRDQFRAMVEGSVFGESAPHPNEEAADASGSGETEAPSGPSIVNGEKSMDTASSTPPSDAEQGTSTPSGGAAGEDNNAQEQDENVLSEPEEPSIEQQPSPSFDPAEEPAGEERAAEAEPSPEPATDPAPQPASAATVPSPTDPPPAAN